METAPDQLRLALQFMNAGRDAEAEGVLRPLLAANPNDARALHLAGLLALRRKDILSAHALIRRSIELEPEMAGYHNNFGEVLRTAGDLAGAEAAYRQALKLDPALADAETNLGLALAGQDRLEEAMACYHAAIALNPRLPQPHNNLGIVYAKLGRLDDAIASYRQAVTIDPNYAQAHSNLLLALNYHPKLAQKTIYEAHRAWGEQFAASFVSVAQEYGNDRDVSRRIRIGYVSPDFRKHSVTYFLEPLLAGHDHNAVHVSCYSDVLVPDETTRRLKRMADNWRDTATLNHVALAQLIRSDEVDVLIDLAGHTASNRMPLFALKPAPVQMTWFGYPNTTGLAAIDYRVTDALSDPPGTEAYHTESLLRLGRLCWCFKPSEEAPEVAPAPALRNGLVTFGSFNNVYKITPDVAAVWSRILKVVPNSRLMILVAGGSEHEYVRALFTGNGIEEGRLILEAKRPRRKYLELMGEVDIALDPFPYNGGITTCECLWQGVPVVCLSGSSYVSRQGQAILTTCGLEALLAGTGEEYVKIAAALPMELSKLSLLRKSLRGRLKSSPLLDGGGCAGEVERVLREIWRAWCGKSQLKKPGLSKSGVR